VCVTNFARKKVVLDNDIKVIVIQESLDFYSSLIDFNEYNRLKEPKPCLWVSLFQPERVENFLGISLWLFSKDNDKDAKKSDEYRKRDRKRGKWRQLYSWDYFCTFTFMVA